jgi:hypothetical protein
MTGDPNRTGMQKVLDPGGLYMGARKEKEMPKQDPLPMPEMTHNP